MNTTENNKLIAEFMGGLWNEPAQKYGIGNAQYVDNGTFKNVVKAKYHYSLNELLYHSSWDWLMEVVKKIKSIETAKIIGITYYDDWEVVINEALISTNIDKIYNICISFIEWYNKQK